MIKKLSHLLIALLLAGICQAQNTFPSTETDTSWKEVIERKLKNYGHRNWIVVADAAYPEQSNSAITTLTIDAPQLEVVSYLNEAVSRASHVRAHIYLDKEIDFVAESSSPGITDYRKGLKTILATQTVKRQLHEGIIKKLDSTANTFSVLVLKTGLTIPYTSVFYQLECGYWTEDDEQQLRKAMKKEQ
jgi:L-fucose mutarotase/ribose pyranase (RbsD/FucU family)